MTSVGFNTIFPRLINSSFVVRNVSQKAIKIFNFKINPGKTQDLMAIPYVSEADIKHSLLKGTLQKKIAQSEITIVESNINLVQYNTEFIEFMQSAGLTVGARDATPNEIIIASLSDLPAPVDGVITLSQSPCVYSVVGKVDLGSNKLLITGNNCIIRGRAPLIDGLIGSVANDNLVEISGGGAEINSVHFTNTSGTGLAVNGDGTGIVIIRDTAFVSCFQAANFNNIITLLSEGLIVNLCVDGIIIDTIDYINIIQIASVACAPTATILTVTSNETISSFNITNGFFLPPHQTAINFDPSITLLERSTVFTSTFQGFGPPLVGITKKDLRWWFFGNDGIVDSRVLGFIGYSVSGSPQTIIINTQNEWVPIDGPYTLDDASERTSLDGYSLVYDGYDSQQLIVTATASFRSASANVETELSIAVNGEIQSVSVVEIQAKTAFETYITLAAVTVFQGDAISLQIRNIESTQNYQINSSRISVM